MAEAPNQWDPEQIGTLAVTRLDLYYAPDWYDFLVHNKDVDTAAELVRRAAERDPSSAAVHDTTHWSEDERLHLYADEIRETAGRMHPSGQWWKYAFSTVLGTNKYPGNYVAAGVPVLLVRFVGPDVPLVAPHQGWNHGATRSVLDVLQMLAPKEQQRLFGELV